MLRMTNFEVTWRRMFCAIIVFVAVTSLAASVATRYCSPQGSSYSVKSLHKPFSPEQSRQRLTKSTANWMPQAMQEINLQAPISYPRIAPAGPPLPSVILETNLYNRPPPVC
jgi:hypothetical protein